MRDTCNHNSGINKQQGAVLVTALVLMAVLAIIGVATMRSNSTDVAIHKNMKSRNNAFQCAEAAVRTGEIWLDSALDQIPTTTTTKPDLSLYQVWDFSAPAIQDIFTKDAAWWAVNGEPGTDLTDADYQIGCAAVPRFIIERVGTVEDSSGSVSIEDQTKSGIDYFRVTGFSVGTGGNTSVLLQTTFAKRLR